MTATKTRAALAALMLAGSAFALTAAHAQDERQVGNSDGSRFQRQAPAKATPPGTLSSAVAKPLTVAQTAMGAKKWADAVQPAKDALAAAKTDYEKLKANEFLTSIYSNLGDNANATIAAEAAADTPRDLIPTEDRLQVYRAGLVLAVNAKHNDKALAYASQLQSLPITDPATQATIQDLVGRALYAAKDPSAPAFFKKEIDATIAAGKVPTRDALQMLMATQINAKDEPAAENTMIQMVRYYNDPADWQQIIDVAITTRGTRDIDFLMLGRLLLTSGAKVSKEDADLFGQTAQKMAIYGDSQAAMAKGATLQLDPARVAADKADVPKQIPMAASQNGLFNIKLAEALYGYGMYAEAETLARAAQSKGGIDMSEAGMLIGISQIMQGKYADGIATLGAVQGGGPVTPRVNELWIAYAKNKGGIAG